MPKQVMPEISLINLKQIKRPLHRHPSFRHNRKRNLKISGMPFSEAGRMSVKRPAGAEHSSATRCIACQYRSVSICASRRNFPMTIRQQFFAYLPWHINPNLPGREIEPDAVSKEHLFGAVAHVVPGNEKRFFENGASGILE
jgi:hypothetical protein